MFKLINILRYGAPVLLLFILLTACGGGGSGSSADSGAGTGTLKLGLTDAFSDDYQAVYITIAEVQAKKQGEGDGEAGWITVVTPGQTYNLLELVNGVIASLGIGELEAGKYGQLRLILQENDAAPDTPERNILDNPHPYFNYLINSEGSEIPLKVPGGGNTGIKLVNGFTIEVAGATELILDFDAHKSIVQAGNSGKWLLKPTVKVVETRENSVSGVVEAGVDEWLEGTLISAQVYDATAEDPRDEVSVAGTTVSDILGDYFVYLPLLGAAGNPYNIVATLAGYETECQKLPSTEAGNNTINFTLTAAVETGSLSGSVTGLETAEDSALFSIRQEDDVCGMTEVASFSVVNSGAADPPVFSDPIILPVGTYQVVVSAEGEETVVLPDVEVLTSPEATVLNVDFAPAP